MDMILKFFNRKIVKQKISIDNLSCNGKKELIGVLEYFSPVIVGNKIEMICNLIKYDVPDSWINRINESIKFGKDSSSLKSYTVRYGDEIGLQLFNEKNKMCSVNKQKYLLSHTEDEWIKLCQNKSNWGLEKCIEKYGKLDGPIKWQERLNKKTETQRKKRESGYVYKNGRTLYEYQLKHGVERGYELWSARNERQRYCTTVEYYNDKYGIENGIKKYEAYICRLIEQRSKIGSYSKISQTLFWLIYNNLSEEKQNKCKFAELNGEEIFYIGGANIKAIKPDFKCGNKIIEFDGIYWHNKPETIELDSIKEHILINKGYEILRVTDNEFINDRTNILNICLNFINENV